MIRKGRELLQTTTIDPTELQHKAIMQTATGESTNKTGSEGNLSASN
jgi:hypothetical protein